MNEPFSFLDIYCFCEQAYDPQTGYDIPYFRPIVDETVRVQGLPSQDVRVVVYIIFSVMFIIFLIHVKWIWTCVCFELLIIVNYNYNDYFLLLERLV